MTEAALAGRGEEMYPGGREVERPRTLLLRDGETAAQLVDSVEATAAALSARWNGMSPADWGRSVRSRDFGTVALSRYLALRLTEIEVHSVDLGFGSLDTWSDMFVNTLLPLRMAWLGLARQRPDADLSLDGSWLLSDGETSWLVKTDGRDVVVGGVPAQRSAYCRLTGTRRDLLALLLGRPAQVEAVGLPELSGGFKTAFPGP